MSFGLFFSNWVNFIRKVLNSFRLYDLRVSRGDPLFMVVIIGASSLHLALEDWASVGGNEEIQEDVILYKGVTFHPQSKANKIVRNILRDENNRNESVLSGTT